MHYLVPTKSTIDTYHVGDIFSGNFTVAAAECFVVRTGKPTRVTSLSRGLLSVDLAYSVPEMWQHKYARIMCNGVVVGIGSITIVGQQTILLSGHPDDEIESIIDIDDMLVFQPATLQKV